MDDNIASQSDTASRNEINTTASNEPTNHSPAAESTHQMSDGNDRDQTSGQAPSGVATDGDSTTDRSDGSQLICASINDNAGDENGLNWRQDQTRPHESSRSSSLNSDRQKVNRVSV